MRIMLKVFICLMTASMSLLSVMGNKGRHVNTNCRNTPKNLTAYCGGSVTINCTYPIGEEKKKSSVRSFFKENGIDVISSYLSEHTKRDRFSLTDDKQKGVYTVNVSSLTRDDAGKYWCALKKFEDNSTTCLTEIHLHILNWDDIKPVNISHVQSGKARIQCKYPDSHKSDEKFLCKGDSPLKCEVLIQPTKQDRYLGDGRFQIRDNQRINYFYVYINNLTEADSGTYWCGSERTMKLDEYTKIHLSVVKGNKPKKSDPPGLQGTTTEPGKTTVKHNDGNNPTNPENQFNFSLIVGVGVCLVFLAVAVIVLILHSCKVLRAQRGSSKPRTNAGHNSEGNNEDHNYEEVHLQNQVERLPSLPATEYATVSLPADLVHYSCVTFQKDKHSPSDTDFNCPAQGATHPPAAEQTLYSTIRACNEEQ